jgi:hypothetical protein
VSLASYADFKVYLAARLDRSDLSSYLDDFIDIAESMHARDIRIREMIQRESLTVDDRQESVPSGCLEVISLRLLTTPVTVLQFVNHHEMNRVRQEVTGRPAYFTIHEEIEFDVEPAESYAGEIIFYKSVTALSSGDTSNAILVKAPDLYLHASMMAACDFIHDDAGFQKHGALYKMGVDALNSRARQARVVGPLVSRVAGATP